MISGEKTVIKGLTKEYAPLIYQWVNREELRTLTGTVYPVSEYEHEEWIRRVATSVDKKVFVICDKVTGEAIGTIGLDKFDQLNRNAELFISIGAQQYISTPGSGGGYGTDAVRALVNYSFNRLNMHKILVRVFESNKRAIRCYEKAGFVREGLLMEQHFQDGKYENVVLMGIIAPR